MPAVWKIPSSGIRPREVSIYRFLKDARRPGWLTYAMEGVERNAARTGLEYRHPFCDRRLIEFVCGPAKEQRWNQCVPKLLMRRAMQGWMPEKVRTRTTKAYFDSNYSQGT
jgi:asparagine synthase (glutamine-hydrolysing)